MITIEQTENLVNVAVMGEFTIADFKAFEEQSLYKLKTPGTVNLLFDLRAMISYTGFSECPARQSDPPLQTVHPAE